jgi:hypothetical protein
MPMSRKLFLGALVVALFSAMAQAAPAAEVSRKTFMKNASANCSGVTCQIDVATIPAKHIYEVAMVSCITSISDVNAKVGVFVLAVVKSGLEIGNLYMKPNANGINGIDIVYSATETGLLLAPAGSKLRVRVARDSTSSGTFNLLKCTISGEDVKLR